MGQFQRELVTLLPRLRRLARALTRDVSDADDLVQLSLARALERQAQWRPRRLRAGPLRDIADWVSQYRQHWEVSFDRLDDYLRELQQEGDHDDDGDDR